MRIRGDRMKGFRYSFLICAGILLVISLVTKAVTEEKAYEATPPFTVDLLRPVKVKGGVEGKETTAYNPKNPYNIFINYELGMHCVGFDISYCCIIPPYNSIQAQAVQAGLQGEKPRLLSPDDKVRLYYWVKDNSYSEGNKMKY